MSARDPIPTTRQRLDGARRELALCAVARRVAAALWQWLALAGAIVSIDVLWPLPAGVRFVAAGLLVVGLVRIAWSCVPPRIVRSASHSRLAREIERRCRLPHNPLINAVQLQTAPVHGAAPDLQALLLDRSAQRGEEAARATGESRLVDAPARNRSRILLLGGAAFAAAVMLLAPRQINAVALRLIDPWGDHPPYTPLTFEVNTEPEASDLIYGDSARVSAQIAGGAVPHADFVWRARGDRGAAPQRQPMSARAGLTAQELPQYSTLLRDCREAIEFMIDTPRGRSRWFILEPRLEPRWASRTLTISGPDYAAAQGPRRLPLADEPEPLRVLEGSRLELNATSTLPLRAMKVTASPDAVALSADRREAEWTWKATPAGRREIDFSLIGPTGLASSRMRVVVEVVADALPVVKIERPPARAAALPDQQFTSRVTASDDLSLADLTLTTQVERNGEIIEEHEQRLGPAEGEGVSRAGARLDVDLMAFDVQPGDIVRMQARASDRRGEEFGGSQTAESTPADILIIDQAAYNAMCQGASPGGESECEGEGQGQGQGQGQGEGQGRGAAGAGGQGSSAGDLPGAASGFSIGGQNGNGEQPGRGASGDADSSDSAASPGAGSSPRGAPGGRTPIDSGGQPTSEQLLARAQAESRSLIEQESEAQPVQGESNPDAPRRHLDSPEDAGEAPLPAASRATQRLGEAQAPDEAGPTLGVPARYRDLVARYFKRLAEASSAEPERSTTRDE